MVEDRARLQAIRKERMRRLRLLEAQAAREGFNTKPETTIEIEQIRRDLGLADAVISSPVSTEMVDAIGPSGQYVALDRRLDQIVDLLSERMDRMEETSHEWRHAERAARIDGQHSYRIVGRAVLLVSSGAMLVSAAALILAIVIAIRVF